MSTLKVVQGNDVLALHRREASHTAKRQPTARSPHKLGLRDIVLALVAGVLQALPDAVLRKPDNLDTAVRPGQDPCRH